VRDARPKWCRHEPTFILPESNPEDILSALRQLLSEKPEVAGYDHRSLSLMLCLRPLPALPP
jgi:hypothetical protein